MLLGNLSHWILILLFFSYSSCLKKSTSEVKFNKTVGLESKKDVLFDTCTFSNINNAKLNTQDFSFFLRSHTLPITSNDLNELNNNVDFIYPLLLNNREQSFENGDTAYYFSKNLKSKVGYLLSEKSKSHKYQLVAFDQFNNLIGQYMTIGLGSEDSPDFFRPFDNNNGFIQFANRLGYSMSLKVFVRIQNNYKENFSIQSEKERINSVCISEDGSSIVTITYDENNTIYLSKYSIDGMKLFSMILQNIDILPNSLFISNDGKYISYFYRKILNNNINESWYIILNSLGNIIFKTPVFHIGNFPARNYSYNNTDYLIVEGHKVYIIDLTNRRLIKELCGNNDKAKAYRVFINNNKLYILFIEYKFINNTKVQDIKYIKTFNIITGENTDSLVIPYIGEISLYLENGQFYLKLEDPYIKLSIYKLQLN
ncbi:MAG: hypothetical protein V9E90_10685 [Saprospiraceae bacterium]